MDRWFARRRRCLAKGGRRNKFSKKERRRARDKAAEAVDFLVGTFIITSTTKVCNYSCHDPASRRKYRTKRGKEEEEESTVRENALRHWRLPRRQSWNLSQGLALPSLAGARFFQYYILLYTEETVSVYAPGIACA